MLYKLRRRMQDEKGFTLIELLVVILIIGILAAIAIPIFLNQRKKAVDAAEKSDVRTVATNMETFYTDNQSYPAKITATVAGNVTTLAVGTENVVLSPGDSAKVNTNANGDSFCVVVSNTKATQNWVWDSAKGGLQGSGTVACDPSYSVVVL